MFRPPKCCARVVDLLEFPADTSCSAVAPMCGAYPRRRFLPATRPPARAGIRRLGIRCPWCRGQPSPDAQSDRQRSDAPDAFRIPQVIPPLPAQPRAAGLRARVIDYLFGSGCCPASGTPVAPRRPTRDLVVVFIITLSSADRGRRPMRLWGNYDSKRQDIHRIVTPDLRRLRSIVSINCEHMQWQTH